MERIARIDVLSLRDEQARPPWQRVGDWLDLLAVLALLVGDDRDLDAAVGLLDVDEP